MVFTASFAFVHGNHTTETVSKVALLAGEDVAFCHERTRLAGAGRTRYPLGILVKACFGGFVHDPEMISFAHSLNSRRWNSLWLDPLLEEDVKLTYVGHTHSLAAIWTTQLVPVLPL